MVKKWTLSTSRADLHDRPCPGYGPRYMFAKSKRYEEPMIVPFIYDQDRYQ